MSKKEEIKKLHESIEQLRDAAERLGDDPVNLSSIELDYMLQEVVSLYGTLHKVHSLNKQPWSSETYNAPNVSEETSSNSEVAETADATNNHGSKQEPEKPNTSSNHPQPETEKVFQPTESKTEVQEEPVKQKVKEQQTKSETSNDEENDPGQNPDNTGKNQLPLDFPENSKENEESKSEVNDLNDRAEEKPKASNNNNNAHKSSLNDKYYDEEKIKKELGEKLKNKRVSNLKSAISLNQKIGFIRHLFKGEEKAYKKAIDFINKCGNYAEAKFYIQDELKPHYNWDEEDPMFQELMELVFRRFI